MAMLNNQMVTKNIFFYIFLYVSPWVSPKVGYPEKSDAIIIIFTLL